MINSKLIILSQYPLTEKVLITRYTSTTNRDTIINQIIVVDNKPQSTMSIKSNLLTSYSDC